MMELLENLTIRPEGKALGAASGDLLSHVLAQIRLTGDVVFPRTLVAEESLDLNADEAHVIVTAAGALRMDDDGLAPEIVDTGDLVLLPRGPGHKRLIASHLGATVIVCRFWFDPDSLRAMIFALPQVIHIRRVEGAEWIDGIFRFLMIEAGDVQPGGSLMISRLIDLVVIRALRTWVQLGQSSGWLGGLSDARIARSLKAIHEEPMQRWSIDALASSAGMSRSSFCERFTALVGRSPLRYQNEWRLRLAREMLAKRDARVGEIGLRIGYESEAAFSRAYKEFFGHSPRVEFALQDGAGA
jgi:AraC-like DNA-binding protein